MTWQFITPHLPVPVCAVAVLYTMRRKIQLLLYTLHGDSKQLNAAETVDRNSFVTVYYVYYVYVGQVPEIKLIMMMMIMCENSEHEINFLIDIFCQCLAVCVGL